MSAFSCSNEAFEVVRQFRLDSRTGSVNLQEVLHFIRIRFKAGPDISPGEVLRIVNPCWVSRVDFVSTVLNMRDGDLEFGIPEILAALARHHRNIRNIIEKEVAVPA